MKVIKGIDQMKIMIFAPVLAREEVKVKSFPKTKDRLGKLKIYSELTKETEKFEEEFGVDLSIDFTQEVPNEYDIDKTKREQENGILILTIPAASDIKSID